MKLNYNKSEYKAAYIIIHINNQNLSFYNDQKEIFDS